MEKVVNGKTIIDIVGSNEKELVSAINAGIIVDSFKEALQKGGNGIVLPDSVIRAIENIDPEGNPFLIIYSY